MDLQKLRSIREGHRRVIQQQLEKIEAAKEKSTLTEFHVILEALTSKAESLLSINQRILELTDVTEIEEEIIQGEEYSLNLEISLRELRAYSRSHGGAASRDLPPLLSARNAPSETDIHTGQSNTASASQLPEFAQRTLSQTSSNSSQFHRLPKLSLPVFNGDILQWQTFWDSFESTIHLNANLTDVQKFSYLKSQLESDAARTIDGFALTNANYLRAVDLLKERYGQQHKITHATTKALLQLPAPTNSLYSLRHFYDKMETYIRGLESVGQFQDTYGSLLVPIVLDKLPGEIRKHLAREHGDSTWQLDDLRRAINKEINIIEAGSSQSQPDVEAYGSTASFFAGARSKPQQPNRTGQSVSTGQRRCNFCDESHSAVDCKKYADAESRVAIVKRNKLCFNCLGKHQVATCKSKRRCQKCHKKHHTSICQTQISQLQQTNHATETQPPNNDATVLHTSSSKSSSGVLLKTAIATVNSSDNYCDATILFDEGSQRSFITETLADELQLTRHNKETVCLSTFGGNNAKIQHMETATVFLMTDAHEQIPVHVLIVPSIATPIDNRRLHAIRNLPYLRGLKLAHPVTGDNSITLSLLIGADHYWDIVEDQIIRGDGPTAVKSKIGYLLSGPVTDTTTSTPVQHILNVMTSPMPTEKALERFWSLESMGIVSDAPDQQVSDYLQQYQKHSIEHRDGRYYAKLPWKQDHEALPSNFDITLKRTESTIQRLRRDPEILRKYDEIIRDQERRGFIEKVPTEKELPPEVHYIPHHPVRKESSTTPVRIVYDCSCRQSSDLPSLNDCLESTPPVTNDLTSILIRFRLNEVALTTDIEKAFLHVGLHETDRDMTRFLWLENPTDPNSLLTTYRFRSVLFGATCSPFILNATLLKHLELNKDIAASSIIERDIYVDNVISSFTSHLDALQYFHEARNLLSSAGMNLRSWTSNSDALQAEASWEGVLDTEPITKVLGLRWEPSTDMLSFARRDFPILTNITKRLILKYSSQIYDPLGLLSPVTVRAKLMLQDLWKQKFDWDVPLPSNVQQMWTDLATDLNTVTSMKFARQFLESGNDNLTLHIFVDASTRSYGAAAYICNNDQSRLVMAKNRVAPLKSLTLPQLELMAAVIGARLATHVRESFPSTAITFWSDSQIVLHWLTTTKSLKRFVARRVTEILEVTKPFKWKYCPTQDNPSDLLTRGVTAQQLLNSDLWESGPSWLCDRNLWPTWNYDSLTVQSVLESEATELRNLPDDHSDDQKIACENKKPAEHNILNIINVERYSSYRFLLRVTAYVLRFVTSCRVEKQNRNVDPLSSNELRTAEKTLLRACQVTEFSDEISSLKSATSRLPLVKQLRLFLDDSGCIRCGGRIHNAPVDEATKFPYLLPKKHHLTRLIARDAHENHMHSGANATVTHIRQKFWIPAIRQAVNSVVRSCVICRRVNGKPYSAPDPPPLPKVRVEESQPFSVTGVDFTGALLIRQSSGNEGKAYICLFTCATTRAVHLEVVTSMSEESFLQAFRRFASRKSLPKLIISDNALTFCSASTYLKTIFESTSVREALANMGIDWQFIPKRAPWYGGWWERLIGLTKSTLKKIIGRAYLSLETLQTVVTEIETIMNDRPLTYVSSNLDDPEPLTPAHLLYGRRITSLPYSDDHSRTGTNLMDCGRTDITKRAKAQAHMIDQFWKRWKTEYLTALREHHRTTGSNSQTIRVGDIVQVHDDCPRARWKLAVVKELMTAKDGLARAAKIRTSNGLFTTRPIVKLYPLEVLHDDQRDCG